MGFILNIDNKFNLRFSNDGKKASLENGTTFTKTDSNTYVNDKTGATYTLNSRGLNSFQNGDTFTSSTGNTFKVEGVLFESNKTSKDLKESIADSSPETKINSSSDIQKCENKTSEEIRESLKGILW